MSVRFQLSAVRARRAMLALSLFGAMVAAGCAGDGDVASAGLTTASLPDHPKTDPACVSLARRIDQLRADGITERAEKVGQGRTPHANTVKRASLARLAELDKTNLEYQGKCGSIGPGMQTAAATAAPQSQAATATAVPPAAAKAAAKVAKPAVARAVAVAAPVAGAATAEQAAGAAQAVTKP